MRTATRLTLGAAAALSLAAGCASEPADTAGGEEVPGSAGQSGTATSPSGHQLRQVPADEAPAIQKFEVDSDPVGGWNIHLRTRGFEFTPANVGETAKYGEGHAHLHIDGEKYTRIYSPWFHLPAHALSRGEHTLKVTLNADDHRTWAVDGEPVQATSRVTASDSSGHDDHHDNGHASSSSHDAAAGAAPADEVVRVRIADGEVGPAPSRVKVDQGERVRLIVSTDHSTTVHVHGYGEEAALEPGRTSTVDLVADQRGVFEVETHDPALQLLQLQVQ